MNEYINAHDLIFKSIMSRKETITAFIKIFLPELAPFIDFNSIKVNKDSLVSKQLRENFTDLVASCNTKKGKAKLVFLYEHKSYKEKYLLLQIEQYVFEIRNFYRRKNEKLPVVIPTVFYHGKPKFVFPNYDEIYTTTEQPFFDYIPKQKILFFDIRTRGEEYLKRAEENYSLMMLIGLLYNVFREPENMVNFIEYIIKQHGKELKSNKDLLDTALNYLMKFRIFAEEPYKSKIMETVVKQIEFEPGSMVEQWFKKGEKSGLKKGEKIGEWRTYLKAVARMIEKGYTDSEIMDILEINKKTLNKIKKELNL